jgi:hypothetical protein
MIATKQISAEVDVRLSRLQQNYAHLQGIATFLAKVVVQMHRDRRQALGLPDDECKSFLAFESMVIQDPGKEALAQRIAKEGCAELFKRSVGKAKEREALGWVMTRDRHPGAPPNEWSRQVLVELSTGEVCISRFRDSRKRDQPGNWQGLSTMAKVTRWHELPYRDPLAKAAQAGQAVEEVIWI